MFGSLYTTDKVLSPRIFLENLVGLASTHCMYLGFLVISWLTGSPLCLLAI